MFGRLQISGVNNQQSARSYFFGGAGDGGKGDYEGGDGVRKLCRYISNEIFNSKLPTKYIRNKGDNRELTWFGKVPTSTGQQQQKLPLYE